MAATVPPRQGALVAPVEVAGRGECPASAFGQLQQPGAARPPGAAGWCRYPRRVMSSTIWPAPCLVTPRRTASALVVEGLRGQRPEDVAVGSREVVVPPLAEVLVQPASRTLVGEGQQDAEVGCCHGPA